LSCECVCKPRWSRKREVSSHPAANLMPFVLGAIDSNLDIEIKIGEVYRKLKDYEPRFRVRCDNIQISATGTKGMEGKTD
jgi:phage baseplate assembly protein W